jgi:SAM-dependent methyltransferase/methyltransferase-like protein
MHAPTIDYDALPYRSMPFPQTQPAHVAALAALQGRRAPAVEAARVLELGCASGGNLIPWAVRFPHARFEGVDLAAHHVEQGQALIEELGLRNVTLQCGDIAALDLADREFDYIVCHGVFSWVPPPVQEAIFRLCAGHLSRDGLAYVSYNVLPGWRLRSVVRDLCRPFALRAAPPQQQLAQARAALQRAAGLADDASAYGLALREEVQRCLLMEDSHFVGEFLGPENDPCRFDDFVARAQAHGLAYLADAGQGEGGLAGLPPDRAAQVRALAEAAGISPEQCLDDLGGRGFRRSLLVRADPARAPDAAAAQRTAAAGLATLHFASPLQRVAPERDVAVFSHAQAQLRTNDPVLVSALAQLTDAWPETRSFPALVAQVSRETGQLPERFVERLGASLRQTIVAGHVTVSTVALRVGGADDDRPALCPLALAQLRRGQAWVASRLHQPVRLPPEVGFVARLLDGTRTVEQLRLRLEAALASGELVGEGADAAAGADAAGRGALAERLLRSSLREFRRSALLSPAG